MIEAGAVRSAIDLLHVPSRVRSAQAMPLPDGMLALLQIAADDRDVQAAAVDLTGRPVEVIKSAAAFFIEQVLLAPGSDSYRVLGADGTATAVELRRNMALLLKALHPDIDQNKERAVYAGRVIRAWEDLKSPERREAYDLEIASRTRAGSGAGRIESDPEAARRRIKRKMRQAGLAGFEQGGMPGMPRRDLGMTGAPRGFLRRALSLILGSDRKH